MNYRVPRPLYESLAEKLGDRALAERFSLSIEEAVDEIGNGVHQEMTDSTGRIKMEVRDDLTKILVTRERFDALQDHIDERFKRIDLKFNVLIGLLIAGFTLFNPGFLELLKIIVQ